MLTESASPYHDLEKMSVNELLIHINEGDKTVAEAVEKALPEIAKAVEAILERLKNGGRLFYLGAGTSGRLGVLDAAECPPTFGVPEGLVIGVIAGGKVALKKAVENVEDNSEQGWKDLRKYNITSKDAVIGIAASGTTPYVIHALTRARLEGVLTSCITCNLNTPLANAVEFSVEIVTGPEFITGSTRMKAGTSQKLALNMISTSLMVKLGRVRDNYMVDMKLNNNKLFKRGTRILTEEFNMEREDAEKMLKEHGSVRKVIEIILGKRDA